ncbi:MAG TPA: hypothetical protein VMV13_04750 [Candidatus Binataceae bacterium]|nr:hypothetical protein [Candidatus Binataceae bacterium]
MYLCICNAITDRQARSQGTASGCSVAAFYRTLGVTLKCGKCVPVLREILGAQSTASETRGDAYGQDTCGG